MLCSILSLSFVLNTLHLPSWRTAHPSHPALLTSRLPCPLASSWVQPMESAGRRWVCGRREGRASPSLLDERQPSPFSAAFSPSCSLRPLLPCLVPPQHASPLTGDFPYSCPHLYKYFLFKILLSTPLGIPRVSCWDTGPSTKK